MLALHNRKLPDNALDLEGVRAQWIRLGQAQPGNRETLELALGTEWPAHVIAETPGDKFLLTREGKGDRVTGTRHSGQGSPIVFDVTECGYLLYVSSGRTA